MAGKKGSAAAEALSEVHALLCDQLLNVVKASIAEPPPPALEAARTIKAQSEAGRSLTAFGTALDRAAEAPPPPAAAPELEEDDSDLDLDLTPEGVAALRTDFGRSAAALGARLASLRPGDAAASRPEPHGARLAVRDQHRSASP